MSETPYYISLQEAINIAHKSPIRIEMEKVPLDEAHGRILATDLSSKVNDPPFDNSAMDGFAVRFEDTNTAPTTLSVVATSQAAASEDSISISTGEAVQIMTGAPLPRGADAIIPIEACTVDGDSVTLNQPSKPNFIRRCGENIKKGVVGLKEGNYLSPQSISMCATMGYDQIPVVKKLKIGIISTGDELKSPGETLSFGEIYESNSYGLSGLVKALGHTSYSIPIRGRFDR